MPALRIYMQPYPKRPGSICCLARDPADPRSLFILTAGHVAAPLDIPDIAAVRRERIQIVCEFPGAGPRTIGTLLDWLPMDYGGGLNPFDAGQVQVHADAAQALLDAVPLPAGVTDLAEENWDICTLGAKTQEPRRGKIQERRVEGLIYQPGDVQSARFDPDNHFSVVPVDGAGPVTLAGDSGAPAFDPSGRLVGMLVSGKTEGGARSYFARAARVLARFGLKPVTHAQHPSGVSALSLWGKAPAAGAVNALAAAPPAPDKSVDVLARTLWGEARSESRQGIEAVACVVVNRAARGPRYWWGGTIVDVCKRPSQFSCWNPGDANLPKLRAVTNADAAFRTCIEVAQAAVAGSLADATAGATHYHTEAVMPWWVKGRTPCKHIGRHLFYNDIE